MKRKLMVLLAMGLTMICSSGLLAQGTVFFEDDFEAHTAGAVPDVPWTTEVYGEATVLVADAGGSAQKVLGFNDATGEYGNTAAARLDLSGYAEASLPYRMSFNVLISQDGQELALNAGNHIDGGAFNLFMRYDSVWSNDITNGGDIQCATITGGDWHKISLELNEKAGSLGYVFTVLIDDVQSDCVGLATFSGSMITHHYRWLDWANEDFALIGAIDEVVAETMAAGDDDDDTGDDDDDDDDDGGCS